MFTVAMASRELGVSARTVQQMIERGSLCVVGTAGRAQVLDELSVQAVGRARGKGRRWSRRTLRAALDILDGGRGEDVSASERSRLRATLRAGSVEDVVHSAAVWKRRYRMRQTRGRREDLQASLRAAGPSRLADGDIAAAFGLMPRKSWMLTGYVMIADDLIRRFGLVFDADGDVALLEVDEIPSDSMARTAVDLVLWGSAREYSAGREWLSEALDRLSS